jgi:hypothetical protein
MRIIATTVFFAIVVSACTSETTTSSTTSHTSSASTDACGFKSDAKVKVQSAKSAADNDPTNCPVLSVDDMNKSLDQPDDSSSDCEPKVDDKACSMTIDCTQTTDSSSIGTKGKFTGGNGELKGTFTTTLTIDGNDPVTCSYAVVFVPK